MDDPTPLTIILCIDLEHKPIQELPRVSQHGRESSAVAVDCACGCKCTGTERTAVLSLPTTNMAYHIPVRWTDPNFWLCTGSAVCLEFPLRSLWRTFSSALHALSRCIHAVEVSTKKEHTNWMPLYSGWNISAQISRTDYRRSRPANIVKWKIGRKIFTPAKNRKKL